MRLTPSGLSELIRTTARDQARLGGMRLTASGENRIGKVPFLYKFKLLTLVDAERLRSTLNEILLLAASHSTTGSEIGYWEVDLALKEAGCHYLWFC